MGTKLTKNELKKVRKNAKEDAKKIKEHVYEMNHDPHPLREISPL
ncbi:MAG: hypothetical protein V3S49_05205 [Thermodesulfobacteriota bacterium]